MTVQFEKHLQVLDAGLLAARRTALLHSRPGLLRRQPTPIPCGLPQKLHAFPLVRLGCAVAAVREKEFPLSRIAARLYAFQSEQTS